MAALIVSTNDALGQRVREVLGRHGYDCPATHVVAPDLAGQYAAHFNPELVVALSPEPGRVSTILEALRPHTQAPVLVVGPVVDARVVLRALRGGAADYLDEGDLEAELASGLRRMQHERGAKAGRLVAVLAPSGGSGSSTLAVNLATVLAQEAKGEGALLIDLKLEAGDTAALLDLKPSFTLANLCQQSGQLDRTMLQRSLAAHASGVKLLAPPHALADVSYVTPEGVRQALALGTAMFSHVVVDLDHTYREEQAQVLRQADVVLLVFRLDFTCLRNARRALEYLVGLGVPAERVRLVVNRHGQPREVPVAKAEQALEAKIFHCVPDDPKAVNHANNHGVPVVLDSPSAKVSRSLTQLARSLGAVEA